MSTAAIALAMSSMALAESSHGCSSGNINIPEDMARVLVGLMLVAFVAGAIKGWQEDGFIGAVMFSIIAPLALALVLLLTGVLCAAVMFVLGVA